MENFKDSLINKKKIGIVCNDAGGSEIISAWLFQKKKNFIYSLSGPAKKIFGKKFKKKKNFKISKLVENSDIIITGTSLHCENEIEAIKYSRIKKKICISFIDHWINYKLRFTRKGKEYLPDILIAHDLKSFFELKKIFKNRVKILIIKNAYFELIKKNYKKIRKTQPEGKYVFFSSNNNKSNTKLTDEKCLIKTINFIKKNFKEKKLINILVRHHPSEKKTKYKNFKYKNTKLIFDQNKDLLKTIFQNRNFFGYESMALVVAKICKKNTFGIYNKNKKYNTIPRSYFNSYFN